MKIELRASPPRVVPCCSAHSPLAAPRSSSPRAGDRDDQVSGRLATLNNSGATGKASVTVGGKELAVRYSAKNLVPNLPHAAHIPYGEQAAHERPTVKDDADHDFRLDVAEGSPSTGRSRCP